MGGSTQLFEHIAISGEVGSGKSTVARELAARYEAQLFSTGEVHREIAALRGRSTLDTNLLAEQDTTIDDYIDNQTRQRALSSLPTVFDSRLAWHFVKGALKVHLLVDAAEGARRIQHRSTAVEAYESEAEALERAEQRRSSERRRFLTRYGVDIGRLRNYDLVVDTTHLGSGEVVSLIEESLNIDPGGQIEQRLFVDSRRVFPIDPLASEVSHPDIASKPRVKTGFTRLPLSYSCPFFFCHDLAGHVALSQALIAGKVLLSARLAYEGRERLPSGLTADQLFAQRASSETIHSWERTHHFSFLSYPKWAVPPKELS